MPRQPTKREVIKGLVRAAQNRSTHTEQSVLMLRRAIALFVEEHAGCFTAELELARLLLALAAKLVLAREFEEPMVCVTVCSGLLSISLSGSIKCRLPDLH